MKKNDKIKLFASGVVSIILLVFFIWVAYKYDNKYTSHSQNIMVLSDNWEYCPGELYLSEDFHNSNVEIESELIYIGQFGDFVDYTGTSTPFGHATYRKTFELAEGGEPWVLMLPEIFSASKVYVNGTCVAELGSISPYAMKTKNTLIPLPDGAVEIVVQAANYSHYYSGMIYPPLLGSTSDILGLIVTQLIIYGLFCFFSIGIAVASISLWRQKGKALLYLYYGLLCLFFAIHVSYPFIHWLGLGNSELLYILEDSSYYAMILCMVLLTADLTKQRYLHMFHKFSAVISVIMILCSVIYPYMVYPYYPEAITGYGYLIAVYKLYISIYLGGASIAGIHRFSRNVWLLYGNLMFGIGIFADFLTAGKYEPLRFGWLEEYASFMMVLLFTVLVLKTNKELSTENERLKDHLQNEVEKKTDFLTRLLDERRSFLASAAHDLKAPASVIQTCVEYIKAGKTKIDTEQDKSLDLIHNKANQIKDSVQSLQLFSVEDRMQDPKNMVDCNEFLNYVYEETCPYADANGIYYSIKLPVESVSVLIQKTRMFRALENIIINSTEHTPLNGTIEISATYEVENIIIKINDNGHGITSETLPHIFEYKFTTQQECGGHGLGLYFSRITIEECGGTVSAVSVPEKETVFVVSLPIAL